MEKIKDMPKLESVFIREEDEDGDYVVTEKITEGMDWVFSGDETEVLATEKMDGTNASIFIKNKEIVSVWNRKEKIPFFSKTKIFITEGIIEAFKRGHTDLSDGQHFGELIGEKLNGNPYNLKGHLWLPFNTYCREHLAYKSFHKYPKSYENIKKWFFSNIKDGGIFSLFMRKKGIEMKPEGIVFHNLKTGQMAKLRLDMFKEYKGKRHKG